jgi:hypothetical protein
MERVAWSERRERALFHVIGDRTTDGWEFFEKEVGEIRWFSIASTQALIAVAERLSQSAGEAKRLEAA